MKVSREEIELKYRLQSRLDYEKLCQGLGVPDEEVEQENHYFQSEDGEMPGEKGVIRIRLEKGTAVFTVKLGGMLVGGISRSQEYEEPWEGGLEELPPSGTVFWERGHAGMDAMEQAFGRRPPLVWAGRMVNRRKLYRLPGGMNLEVDESRYPDGQSDYEVELETAEPERERERLQALMDRFDICYVPQVKTKYERFLDHAGHRPLRWDA